MAAQTTTDDITLRIQSIQWLLSQPPEKISLSSELRKDCETRLQQLLHKQKQYEKKK